MMAIENHIGDFKVTDSGTYETCDKSHYYKQVYLRRMCFSKALSFVVAQFIAPCVSPEE